MEENRENKITTGIAIAPSIHAWLKNRAAKRKTSVSQIIVIAILDYMEKIDREEDR